jgi:predicted ester cyclase
MQSTTAGKSTGGDVASVVSGSADPDIQGAEGLPSTASERRAAEELALSFYVPFKTGETGAYDQVLSEDWIDEPLMEGQRPGRDGFKLLIAGYRNIFRDLAIVSQMAVVSADATMVTVLSVLSGTQSAAFLGVPPMNRNITFRAADVHRIENGLIVQTWHLEDLYGAYQQLISGTHS